MVREKSGLPDGRPSQSTAAAITYGRYQLIKKLATGGMAEVYLSRQLGLEGFEKLLVVKRILPHLATDEEFVQMFLNEARIAARFTHPNIVQIYDLGKIENTYFIGMEYVHGEDLGRIMRKAWNAGTWIRTELSLRIIAGACEGLYYAHTKADESGRALNVVHRDISPQNILVSFDGGVKIVDFGIAKAADSSSGTRNGTIKGKYAYMSPEQAQGKPVDCRTDVFALGLVLYELLTGTRPLKRDTDIQTLQAALACEIVPPSQASQGVPESLDAVVMRALARDVADRYQTARELQLAIEDYLVHERLSASSVHLSEFMRELFADRLEEEARSGKPQPSMTSESQQSFPVIDVATGPEQSDPVLTDAPQPRRTSTGEKPRTNTRSQLASAPPKPADVADDLVGPDPDDGPTTQEVKPVPRRTSTGSQRRATGEQRRASGESAAPRRPTANAPRTTSGSGRARSLSNPGMPEAPPRAAESRARDDSWKEANKPDRGPARRRSSMVPAVAILCLVVLTGALVFRDRIVAVLNHQKDQQGGGNNVAPSLVMLNLSTNYAVDVEINGDLVGRTPVKNYPVPPGPVKVHYVDPAQGVDRMVNLSVPSQHSFDHHEEFKIANVHFAVDRSGVVADILLNGRVIAKSGGAGAQLADGDYEFIAKANNGTLSGSLKYHVDGDGKVKYVTIPLRRN